MSDQTTAQPTDEKAPTILMLPMTRKQAIMALYLAAGKGRKRGEEPTTWTTVTLSDGALD